jgi:hypothetical protein
MLSRELAFSLEKFRARVGCALCNRRNYYEDQHQDDGEKKSEKICQGFLNLADKLLEESGLGHQPEDNLGP